MGGLTPTQAFPPRIAGGGVFIALDHSLPFKDETASRALVARCTAQHPCTASLGLPLFEVQVISADIANG